MDTSQSAGMDAKKNPIESLTREELINKYKGLLGIARQAKKAKDEFAEENQKLKEQLTNCETQREADKKSLLTMKEMLEEFTRNKLEMTSEITDLRARNKSLVDERVSTETLSIENEALRRQLNRLTEDNESLLTDIDQMEQQLKQVNVLGMEQKKHLDLLELEVEKLKDYEATSRKLETQLQDLIQENKTLQESYNTSQTESQGIAAKYQSLREINSEQRAKFNGLKERFIEVHKKLKQLQECKRVLVESHHEYADSVSRWQLEIMHASDQLCNHIQSLTKENTELKRDMHTANGDVSIALPKLPVLIEYCEKALVEYRRQKEEIEELKRENEKLKGERLVTDEDDRGHVGKEKLSALTLENERLKQDIEKIRKEVELPKTESDNLKDVSQRKLGFDEGVKTLGAENVILEEEVRKAQLTTDAADNVVVTERSRFEQEIGVNKLSFAEEVNRLKTENEKLQEEAVNTVKEVEKLKADCAELTKSRLTLDEEVNSLRLENARLEEEVFKAKLSAEEEDNLLKENASRLMEENTKLQEKAVNTDKEVEELKAENAELTKSKLSSDEEVNTLRTENARLEEEVEKVRLSAEEENNLLKKEYARLEQELGTAEFSLNEEVGRLKTENAKLKEKVASADEEAKKLQSEHANLGAELARIKLGLDEEINAMAAKNSKLEEEAANTHKELRQLETEYAAVSRSKLSLDEEIKQMRTKNAELEEELAKTKLTADKKIEYQVAEEEEKKSKLNLWELQIKEIEGLRKTNKELQDELQALRSVESIVASYLPSIDDCCERALLEHRHLTKGLEELRADVKENEELECLRVANASLRNGVAQTQAASLELETLRSENARFKEDLSKAKQNEVEVREVLKLRSDLLATRQHCEDFQTKLEKQERENTDLLNEMRELNEALKGRGDVISRQQAKHQELVTEIKKTSNALTKVEADLSAKETVIKEKELKIAKMSEDNTLALQEVNRLQNISRENESRIKTLSEEITAMRAQFENHETQSEALSTSTISRAEELARLREVDESFEEKYNKLRSLAARYKKKAHEQSLCIADLEKQAVDSKSKAAEASERITTLENERESFHKELKACKTQIETLKGEIDKLRASKKQSNVLTLEIEAFEKSLNETSAKLTAKTGEYDLMRETLQSKESAIEVMKKEIKILEESKESEKVHSVDLKKQIDKLQAQLKDVIHSKQEVAAKLEETQNEKQSLQSDLEEINQRLASIAVEREAEQVRLQSEKENLLQTINSLEDELNASNNRIILAERSFQDLHHEYSNYKVKAQSVLRQNQTKESSRERELEEELTLLKAEHKDLSNRLQTFLEKFQTSEKQIEELQEDNRCLQNRNSELTSTIADIRQQTEVLLQENRKQIETYQETLKGHRLQIEALNSCHLDQMRDLQAKYDREISELKASHKKDSEAALQKPLEKLDYILMEREDAEGSEAETNHTPKYLPSAKRSAHDLVPLDELLSSPTVDSTYTVLERRRSISPSVELQETKERLQKQESRVRHLTSLLAESEQDLARLTQLNEMLKEEVRRQERTVEREKHMHNSEYLKNVVLKFVSLNNVDERTRLVPVLNTILKLSPSETEMLQNVAKGKAADNNNRTWGSFLPHWGTS